MSRSARKVTSGGDVAGLPDSFARLGLRCPADLLLYFPLRYEDDTHIMPLGDLSNGQSVQVQGRVVSVRQRPRPRQQLAVTLDDGTGQLELRFLHVWPGQASRMAVGQLLRASGDVRGTLAGFEMVHPRWRVVTPEEPLPEGLTPVYPVAAGISQSLVRRHVARVLATLPLVDTLPDSLLCELSLNGFADSVRFLHAPSPEARVAELSDRRHPAWQRIKFDELLAQQLALRQSRDQRRQKGALPLRQGELTRRFLDQLPFALTQAQQKVWSEIARDLARPFPMQRLLQGDVGSGKTVVAALAAALSLDSGCQVAFMAPTELLAEQHLRKLQEWFAPLGIVVGWLAGSQSRRERQAVVDALQSGQMGLVAGTHALFQTEVSFANLGLAVIDEQHRFGVAQRLALRNKGGSPHQLMMSATPIPRTLAMSYHADLDVSVIDALPPGRSPVQTRLIEESRRDQVVAWVGQRCRAGVQAYWVCPLIEESETLQLKTALETYANLQVALPDCRIGLLHGRMRSSDKATVMAGFAAGQLDLLVSTTVIEVGVDVPNASLMIIEHAERMGLAQLHQLRGRVGRGSVASICVLMFHEPMSELARARLKVIWESNDGFRIAREDLRLRGPGELLGARQSGVPMLRFADLEQDEDLLELAAQTADRLLQAHPANALAHLARWYGERQEYGKT